MNDWLRYQKMEPIIEFSSEIHHAR